MDDRWTIIIVLLCAIPFIYILLRILAWVRALFWKDKDKWMKEGRQEAIGEIVERVMKAWERDGRVAPGTEKILDRITDDRVVVRLRDGDTNPGMSVGVVMQWVLGVWLGLGLFWGSTVRWPQFWALCWGFGFGLILPSLVTWKEWKRLKWAPAGNVTSPRLRPKLAGRQSSRRPRPRSTLPLDSGTPGPEPETSSPASPATVVEETIDPAARRSQRPQSRS